MKGFFKTLAAPFIIAAFLVWSFIEVGILNRKDNGDGDDD